MEPYPDFWLDRGVLGVFAFLVIAAITWGVRELWGVLKPHMIAKQEVQLNKERAACALYDTLRENSITSTAILETLSETQIKHAASCGETHTLVRDIHDIVYKKRRNHPEH